MHDTRCCYCQSLVLGKIAIYTLNSFKYALTKLSRDHQSDSILLYKLRGEHENVSFTLPLAGWPEACRRILISGSYVNNYTVCIN